MNEFDLLNSPLEGRNLIEAGAGTGKTYTIAGLYIRLLLEKRLSVDQILVVTFTVAATEELRDRIRKKIRETLDAFTGKPCQDEFVAGMVVKYKDVSQTLVLLTNALACFDEAAIFTIHGFCQRILQDKAFECRSLFNTELLTDQSALVREVVDDFWRIHFYSTSPGFMSFVKRRKDKGFNPDALAAFVSRNVGKIHQLVLPEIEAPDTHEQEQVCWNVFERVRQAWVKAKGEVENLFFTNQSLNKKMYAQAKIPILLERLERYLEADRLFPCFDKFDKFTTGALQKATKKGCDPPQHPFFDLCDELLKELKGLEVLFEQRLLALIRELLAFAREKLPKRKEDLNIRAFDDLLLDLRSALKNEGGDTLARAIGQKYPSALIDEFQDTDLIQYDIFKILYPDKQDLLFLIGDPKQAIYRFRGADIFAYMEAAGKVDSKYTLGTNWRSVPELVRAVNTLFLNRDNAFVFKDISFHPAKSGHEKEKEASFILEGELDKTPFHVWFMERRDSQKYITIGDGEKEISKAVTVEIGRLLKAGKQGLCLIEGRAIESGDIAVLVRTNRQAHIMQKILWRYAIPCVLYSTESLFVSREAGELFRVLTAVAEYGNEAKIKAAIVTDIFGISGNQLARLIDDEIKWEEWLERFRGYHDLWARQGFITMAGRLMAEESVRSRLLAYPNGERRLTNVLHFLEVLHQAVLENKLGIEGLMKWFAGQIEDQPDKEEYQTRLETDEKAVKVVTIHRSKGLEYPIVFCPFSWSGSRATFNPRIIKMLSFHDPLRRQATLDLGSENFDLHKALTEQENLAENLRMLYVALTRAKYRCYLIWGAFRYAETSAPAYLFHQPKKDALELTENVKLDDDKGDKESITQWCNIPDDDNKMREDLRSLTQKASKAIQVSSMPDDSPEPYIIEQEDITEPACRIFLGDIVSDWHIASFSSLISGKSEAPEMPGWDEGQPSADFGGQERPAEADVNDLTIFDFPKGTKAGTCLHEIFEHIEYNEKNQEAREKVVRDRLTAHGFDEVWTLPVCSMLTTIFATPLLEGQKDFTLSSLSRKDRVNEMEFYFPLERITSQKLGKIFTAHGGFPSTGNFSGAIEKLNFTPVRGLLKGYIDLVFCYKGRYYLADWKSNYLGSRIEDYGGKELRAVMAHKHYFLQYHLYSVALHKYLAGRISGYDYQTHFGGVFYIFLRGVDPAAGSKFGIYQDLPPRSLIEGLSQYLCGEV